MDHERYNTSKEALRDEVDGIYLQLSTKIEEYGNSIRNTSKGSKDEMIGHLNKLKKDQFKLKQILVDIDGCENPDWESFREEAEKATLEIKDNLETEIPSSI